MDTDESNSFEPLFGVEPSLDRLNIKISSKSKQKTVSQYNVNEIDSETFIKKFASQKPVLLKGFMNSEWQSWTPDTLCQLFSEPLTVFTSLDNRNFIDNDLTCEKVLREPNELFDAIFNRHSQQRLYLRYVLPDALLSSIDQTPLQKLLGRGANDKDNTSLMRVWIGTAGNITPIHYDRCHGLLSQIYGRKKVTLISPKYTQDVYPHDSHSTRAHCSRVNLLKWDEGDIDQVTKYPRFGRAKRIEVVLEKGDILYTPPGWWHHVESVTASVSVTVPFDMKFGDFIPPNMII
jgi:lysine-specific demethylase 8